MKWFAPILLLVSSCSQYPDNPIEELVELKIEEYTGIDLDLTADDEKI